MSTFNISTRDRNNKPSAMQLPVADASGAAQAVTLAAAINALIRGSDVRITETISETHVAGVPNPSADIDADRGNKWLFRVQDNTTGEIYTYEIGTADNGILPSSDSDFIALGAGVGLAVKNEIEAVYESKAGNTGTLLSVQQVNRAG